MDKAVTDAVELLKRLIATPSLSRDEAHTAELIAGYLAEHGAVPERLANNVWVRSEGFDPARPTLLLNSHHDTVRPAASYTRDPFVPTVEGDRLYGLGSNDAGASAVCLIQTFLTFRKRELPFNLVLAVSAEEECMGEHGMRALLPALGRIDMALVGEPTGMQPAVAEKGLMVLDCVSTGKAGHAARNEGINAITLAMKDIEWFNTYQFPEKSDFLGPVKMSVTIIHAGTQHNVVPDRCEFTVDIRTNEFYPNEKLFELIKSQVGCEIKARSFRLNSTRTDLQHPFVRRAVMMGKEPFGSPTLSDQALMHFPSVKIGPGNSARSHAADEYIGLMEIREAIDMYIKLLDQLTIDN